jgi:diamine N-acetyltransferase
VKREAFGAKALVDGPASSHTRNEQSRWPNIPQNPNGLAALQHIWTFWVDNASESWFEGIMITYRTPTATDCAALAELSESTFVEAFGPLYSAENLSKFVNRVYAPDTIAADLANLNRLYRIAEADGQMLGYAKLGLDVSLDYDPGSRRTMELKQLYIRQSHLGVGIAQHLMDWTLSEARARGFDDVILSVYSDNPRAQRFYQKYGFEHFADTYFMVGDHRDDEHLYRLTLTA